MSLQAKSKLQLVNKIQTSGRSLDFCLSSHLKILYHTVYTSNCVLYIIGVLDWCRVLLPRKVKFF